MRIPVFCSLIPAELLISLGHDCHFLAADEIVGLKEEGYQCAFHDNLCSYAKALLGYFVRSHHLYDVIIVPTSCDALKKLSNALTALIPKEKVCVLDVPQNKGVPAQRFLASELKKLSSRLGRGHSRNFSPPPNGMGPREGKSKKIGILGANVLLGVFRAAFEKFGFEAVFLNQCLFKSYPDMDLALILEKGGVASYAGRFLEKNSCPRTNDSGCKELLKRKIQEEGVSGLVVNAMKFCDFQYFDYQYFREALNIPALLIEHDLEGNYEGQIMTRLDAFLEQFETKRGKSKKGVYREGYFAGIDSGSNTTKLVCIDKDKNVVFMSLVPTGTNVQRSVEALLAALHEKGIGRKDIVRFVATGYGRSNVKGADVIVTEISCHAAGAYHRLQKSATIIDIGGQDSKAIKIDGRGAVVQFAMNDKCAAGTGRFLEVIAHKLEMSLPEFSALALKANAAVDVSSMCSVFAESEVISLIAAGKKREEIARGIHRAIAERVASLSRRVGGDPPYYMAGGVAKNACLVRELEGRLGSKVFVIDEPQFSGALGAALLARSSF